MKASRTWAFALGGEQVTGLACILLGVVIAFMSLDGDAPPPRDRLQAAVGKVAFVEGHKRVLRFRLAGDSRLFAYPSKNGDVREAQQAIAEAGEKPVRISSAPGCFS